MTYLKSKSSDAEQLLLKTRERHYVFFVTNTQDESQEFIDHFYKGLLQSKKWHITDNNKWKVIEFHFHEDVYAETIEVIFEKNYITDRRVSLAFEASTIKLLRDQKTSLNKLYRTFQYAFKYNYLFCVFLDPDLDGDSVLKMYRDIHTIFISAVLRKGEPLYCIICISEEHKNYLKENTDGILNSSIDDQRIFTLSTLTNVEIENALNAFDIFKTSVQEHRNDLIEEILESDDVLLQLKNAIRKLSVGIMPRRERPKTPLHIGKSSAPVLHIKKGEEQVSSGKAVEKQGEKEKKKEVEQVLDPVIHSLGTRFQRNNFKKILLIAFEISEADTLNHHDLNAWELASVLRINEKDINNAVHPFVEKKFIYFDAESQGDISFLNTNAFYHWTYLIDLCKSNRSFIMLYERIRELLEVTSVENAASQLRSEDWKLLELEDLEFFVDFHSNKFAGLQEKIASIRENKPEEKSEGKSEESLKESEGVGGESEESLRESEGVNEEYPEVIKIKIGGERPKFSMTKKSGEESEESLRESEGVGGKSKEKSEEVLELIVLESDEGPESEEKSEEIREVEEILDSEEVEVKPEGVINESEAGIEESEEIEEEEVGLEAEHVFQQSEPVVEESIEVADDFEESEIVNGESEIVGGESEEFGVESEESLRESEEVLELEEELAEEEEEKEDEIVEEIMSESEEVADESEGVEEESQEVEGKSEEVLESEEILESVTIIDSEEVEEESEEIEVLEKAISDPVIIDKEIQVSEVNTEIIEEEEIDDTPKTVKIQPLKMEPVENTTDEEKPNEPPPGNTLKIKPISIRPVEDNDEEEVVRPKLTFKKRE